MKKLIRRSLVAALIAAAPVPTALAQIAPSLGTAQSFGVLGGSAVTNTGSTGIDGDLGVSPGASITGFPPGIVSGTTHAGDTLAAQAQAATNTAYLALASQPCTTTYSIPTDLGGLTLVPGVYCFNSSAGLTGTLTLNALGDPAAVWIFRTGSTLTTASGSQVSFINNVGQPCNVFWQIGSSATLGTNSPFVGNILAVTSITLTTNALVSGRALALHGAVTLDSSDVNVPSCPAVVAAPSVSTSFTPDTLIAGGVATLAITLTNPNATAATSIAPFVDTLPAGVTVVGNASNTCGGALTANPGAGTVTLTGGAIPANGSCTVTVDVTAVGTGVFNNVIPAGALQTSQGNNLTPAGTTLVVRCLGKGCWDPLLRLRE